MNINIHDIIDKEYKTVEENQTLHKALNKFDESKDVIIVRDKENNYKGILILKDALKAGVDSKHMHVKKLTRHAPRLNITKHDLLDVLRLMNENNLLHLPVFKNEEMKGVAHADKILNQLKDKDITNKAVKRIMTKDVKTMHPDNTLAQAMTFLRDHAVSRIPIEQKGKLVGILTIKDILQKALTPRDKPGRQEYYSDKEKMLNVTLESLMDRNIPTIQPQHPVSQAITTMTERNTGSLIVEVNDIIKGILTKKDLLKELYYQTAKDHQEKDEIMVQVSSKVDNINRQALLDKLQTFAQKYKAQLGPGTINIHLTKHNERLKGQPLIHTRIRVRTAKTNITVKGEGWGDLHSLRIVLRKARSLILKKHQEHSKKSYREVMDYTDLTSL